MPGVGIGTYAPASASGAGALGGGGALAGGALRSSGGGSDEAVPGIGMPKKSAAEASVGADRSASARAPAIASVPREIFIAITRGMLLLCKHNQRNSTNRIKL